MTHETREVINRIDAALKNETNNNDPSTQPGLHLALLIVHSIAEDYDHLAGDAA